MHENRTKGCVCPFQHTAGASILSSMRQKSLLPRWWTSEPACPVGLADSPPCFPRILMTNPPAIIGAGESCAVSRQPPPDFACASTVHVAGRDCRRCKNEQTASAAARAGGFRINLPTILSSRLRLSRALPQVFRQSGRHGGRGKQNTIFLNKKGQSKTNLFC